MLAAALLKKLVDAFSPLPFAKSCKFSFVTAPLGLHDGIYSALTAMYISRCKPFVLFGWPCVVNKCRQSNCCSGWPRSIPARGNPKPTRNSGPSPNHLKTLP